MRVESPAALTAFAMNPIRILLFTFCLTFVLPSGAEEPAGGWRFSLTPFLWLPNVSSNLKYSAPPGAGSPSVETGPNDYLQNLDMLVMLSGEARKGDWAIFTDVIYLDFSGEDGNVKSVSGPGGVEMPVNSATQTGLKGYVAQVAASHVVSRSDANTFELLGGVRYLGVEGSVDWQFAAPIGLLTQSGSLSQKADLWDAIVGFRGKARFGNNWFVPYYLDAGAGNSELTWQALAGLGYAFDWGDILFAYRHLSYDQSGDRLVQDVRFSGPGVAATFRF